MAECQNLEAEWNLTIEYKEKAMAPHSSILAWKTPWTEKSGGLQSMGSERVRHHWATSLSFTFYFKIFPKMAVKIVSRNDVSSERLNEGMSTFKFTHVIIGKMQLLHIIGWRDSFSY